MLRRYLSFGFHTKKHAIGASDFVSKRVLHGFPHPIMTIDHNKQIITKYFIQRNDEDK